MSEQNRISAVETALRAACVEARAQGLVLVRGRDMVTVGDVIVGCCAWGAHQFLVGGYTLEDLEIDADEYDAIERGWDGERAAAKRAGLPMPWFDLGARLAAEFQPVAARELGVG